MLAELKFKAAGKSGRAGLSGRFAREKADDAMAPDAPSNFNAWVASFHLKLPISADLLFQTEGFLGTNMRDFRGGLGYSTNAAGETIDGWGGWAQLDYSLGKVAFQVGSGMDDPKDSQLATGARVRNSAFWARVTYQPFALTTFGLASSRLTTEYKDGDAASSNRGVFYTQINF